MWPGRTADHSPPSSAAVMEGAELYLYPPSGPHWACNGITLPLPFLLTVTNSTIYFIPDPELYCDLDGLVCLGKYFEMLRTRKVSESSFIQGFYCPCVDTCDAIAIEFVRWVQDVSQK